MKLHLTRAEGLNHFTACGPGYAQINGRRHDAAVIVTATQIVEWNVAQFDALNPAHFAAIADLQPEIVVFGSGASLRFPPAPLLRCLVGARIGFEAMDTCAACRTFNVLLAEGRKVAAALLFD